MVHRRIEEACRRVGRLPDEITLVAVTKTVPAETVQELIAAGVSHIGENRVQEAREKFPQLSSRVSRHLIGHLQTNKARMVPELFDWVHSIDRERVALELDRRAAAAGRELNVLLQVNVADEKSKYGIAPAELPSLAKTVARCEALNVRGLMTMAPLTDDVDRIRSVFRRLRELADELRERAIDRVHMEHLSMGMSNDYEIAVEEGATMLRIGSAITGPRTV